MFSWSRRRCLLELSLALREAYSLLAPKQQCRFVTSVATDLARSAAELAEGYITADSDKEHLRSGPPIRKHGYFKSKDTERTMRRNGDPLSLEKVVSNTVVRRLPRIWHSNRTPIGRILYGHP